MGHRTKAIAIVLVGTALIGACRQASTPVAKRADKDSSPLPIVLMEAEVDKTWIDPPGDARPSMTADEAVAAYQARNAEAHIPAERSALLGLYNVTIADRFTYKDRLVWGISWHLCAVFAHPVPSGTHVPCTFWLILDANTGEMIEGLWQQGS